MKRFQVSAFLAACLLAGLALAAAGAGEPRPAERLPPEPGAGDVPLNLTAERLTADESTFKLEYEGATIEATACDPITTNETFSRDFIMVNSQIYRNAYDRNNNYFNQSFMTAPVETRDLDCVTYNNLQGFHPLLKNLKAVHFYGSKDKDITWYYETCENNVCGNLFAK